MTEKPKPRADSPVLLIRAAFGGALMGIANVVPGISGGTMLLASGIYPRFISAIAEVTTFRFRLASLAILATVAAAAVIAIALLAGPLKNLVVDHRWIMYSLFIGLTLGGVPLVWKLARPATTPVWIGAVAGFAAMCALAWSQTTGAGTAGHAGTGYAPLFIAGLAGASAMILPGLSGGYLLLVLGQYIPILASIERARDAAAARDLAAAAAELHVFIPVGLGVAFGIVAVSNVLKWLLTRTPKPTLGVLLGLLVGAVAGLWPFQRAAAPPHGSEFLHRGATVVITDETLAAIKPEDWPVEFFTPSPIQILAALALIAAGFAVTTLVSRIGGDAAGRIS